MIDSRCDKKTFLSIFLIVFLLLPFSYNCIETPQDFKAPSWTTQLTVPLLQKTYYFNDLIKKDPSFSTVNGALVYRPASMQNEPTAITIPDLKPLSASFIRQIGVIPSQSFNTPPQSFTLPAGIPLVAPLTKDTTITIVSDTASFDYLKYENGQMKLTITNTFNFDITFTSPIVVTNSDKFGSNLGTVGSFTLGTISKNGQTKSDSFSLAGQTLNSIIKMKFTFTSETNPLITTNNGSLNVSMAINKPGGGNPNLTEAKMKLTNEFYIPVTSIRDSIQQIDDSIYIKSAEFTSGDFNINIQNSIPFDIIVEFKLRELVEKQNNSSFRLRDEATQQSKDSISIVGNHIYNEPYDLRNYRMEARRANGALDTLTRGLHFSLNIKTLVRTNVKKVIRKTDSVTVQIIPKQIGNVSQPYVLDNVRGKIPPTQVLIKDTAGAGIGSSTEKFSADSVKFEGAQIILKIFTKSLFPTDLKFSVTGILNGAPGQSLSTPKGTGRNTSFDDPNSFRIFPGDTAKIIFNDTLPDFNGKTLSKFLSSFVQNGKFTFPEKFLISGTAMLEPSDAYSKDSVGYVKNHDSVYTSLDFTFPLKIGIANGSYKDTASISANISDTAQVNSIEEGKIFFDLISTFPVGVEVRSKLLKPDPADSSRASRTAPPVLVLDTIRVEGSPDHTNKSSFTFVSLSGSEAAKISQAGFNAVDIKLVTALNNGNTPIAFQSKDSIVVRTSANLKFNVDIDRLSNNK